MLRGENLTFTYGKGTASEHQVLKGISFAIEPGDFIGLIGSSGSGKTTFIKHLNGILKAGSGDVLFEGQSIYRKNYPISNLRKEVGVVFQYPEHQLFGKTVLTDVMFGPLNMGMTKEEAEESAKESLELVGISEEYYCNSPLEISGGQKRCVAIAGVLAMNPKVLVLDEPAAGLDPETKHEVFDLITRIQEERNIAIVLVSHHMEDVAYYANKVWVLHDGQIVLRGTPQRIFSQIEFLQKIGIGVPQIASVFWKLKERGLKIEKIPVTLEEAEDVVLGMQKGEDV